MVPAPAEVGQQRPALSPEPAPPDEKPTAQILRLLGSSAWCGRPPLQLPPALRSPSSAPLHKCFHPLALLRVCRDRPGAQEAGVEKQQPGSRWRRMERDDLDLDLELAAAAAPDAAVAAAVVAAPEAAAASGTSQQVLARFDLIIHASIYLRLLVPARPQLTMRARCWSYERWWWRRPRR